VFGVGPVRGVEGKLNGQRAELCVVLVSYKVGMARGEIYRQGRPLKEETRGVGTSALAELRPLKENPAQCAGIYLVLSFRSAQAAHSSPPRKKQVPF
jgi:hypothetical protein